MSDYSASGQEFSSSGSKHSGLMLSFTSSLFLSALLLFAIQPLFAKMVLPRLGGAPAVWSVAMCFFQAMVLAGYAYAHGLVRWFGVRQGIIIHMVVLLLALLTLPIGVAAGWDTPPESGVRLWVVGLLTASIGLPFFALSGNGPLLQAWFSRSNHRHAHDPYFLYGASNIGSLLALLTYPFLMEPNMKLGDQSLTWSAGYLLLVGLVGISGIKVWNIRMAKPEEEKAVQDDEPVFWSSRVSWVALSFIPSALLVAVTNHITTDVAAAPFLWIIPLSLYLITFIITFQRKPVLPYGLMLKLQPVFIGGLLVSVLFPIGKFWLLFLVIHLLAFFVTAMVCHGRLVQLRPKAHHLTEFYLWMSFGGMLGGLFAGLGAPYIFSTVIEYPLMIVLALLARPGLIDKGVKGVSKQAVIVGSVMAVLIVLAIIPKQMFGFEVIEQKPVAYIIISALLISAVVVTRNMPMWFAGFLGTAFIVGHMLQPNADKKESYRGFFGVNYVSESSDGKYRLLTHGTTLHGAMKINQETPPEPLTYYHYDSPFADALKEIRKVRSFSDVGVVGLGAGSLACYKKPGENWLFYEIDPLVVMLAKDSSKFRFLSDCAPKAPVILGDARLTLQKDPKQKFDFLVVDAFSSDVVPVHLLTVEAMKMYISKLKDKGVLLLHISNRHMNLAPVISALAKELKLHGMVGVKRPKAEKGNEDSIRHKSASRVAVLAKNPEDIKALSGLEGWKALPEKTGKVWTDDYSDVLGVLLEGVF